MKTPRVQDFDPNAKLPQLGSPMEDLPAIQKPPVKSLPIQTITKEQQTDTTLPYARTSERPHERTNVRRQTIRYAFEFFLDQIDAIRKLALEEKIQGGKGNQSEMVREALDAYLTKKKSAK